MKINVKRLFIVGALVGGSVWMIHTPEPPQTPQQIAAHKTKCIAEHNEWSEKDHECYCGFECIQASKYHRDQIDGITKMYSWWR
jgi:hypothetical protein